MDKYSWVADWVNIQAARPGDMLCPTNPLRNTEKINDLLGNDTSGAGQALSKIVRSDFQDLAPDRVTRAEDFPEREDQSLAAVQAKEYSGRTRDFGFFDQERHVEGNALRVGRIQIACVVNCGVDAESLRLSLTAAAPHVEHVIRRDAIAVFGGAGNDVIVISPLSQSRRCSQGTRAPTRSTAAEART